MVSTGEEDGSPARSFFKNVIFFFLPFLQGAVRGFSFLHFHDSFVRQIGLKQWLAQGYPGSITVRRGFEPGDIPALI